MHEKRLLECWRRQRKEEIYIVWTKSGIYIAPLRDVDLLVPYLFCVPLASGCCSEGDLEKQAEVILEGANRLREGKSFVSFLCEHPKLSYTGGIS